MLQSFIKFNYSSKLLEIARARAAQYQYHFSNDAESQLTNFINAGISKVSDQRIESDGDIIIENVKKIVDFMVKNASSRNLNESLDLTSFTNSIKGLCPIWPFC